MSGQTPQFVALLCADLIFHDQLAQEMGSFQIFRVKNAWLVVYLPLWKNMSSSVGMMKFPTEWEVIKFHGSKPPTSIAWHKSSTFQIFQRIALNSPAISSYQPGTWSPPLSRDGSAQRIRRVRSHRSAWGCGHVCLVSLDIWGFHKWGYPKMDCL